MTFVWQKHAWLLWNSLGRLGNNFPTITLLLNLFKFYHLHKYPTFHLDHMDTVLNFSIHSISLLILRTAAPRSITPHLVLPLPCHFSIACTIYLALLHSRVKKYPANYFQEFDFIFQLILALSLANTIFCCWRVSPTYCTKQFQQVIKFIILGELHVT